MENGTTGNKTNTMLGINSYGDELTEDEINKNVHRGLVEDPRPTAIRFSQRTGIEAFPQTC